MAANLRQPPRPPFKAERGRCALCGGPIPKGCYSWCRACPPVWRLATASTAVLRAHLAAVDGPACRSCGEPGTEVDHVRPLWSLAPDERSQLRWWLPFNLQLLCRSCHAAKTALEAAERARLRRRVPVCREAFAA